MPVEPVAATRADLERVHPAPYLDRIEGICAVGGGRLDPDTYASAGSWNAAVLAAGAGLTAVRALPRGPRRCRVLRGAPARATTPPPPSRWASASSTTSPSWPPRWPTEGERVLVFDYDAHHGNGTQDIFYDDPRVLFVSLHQWPLYPGTGRHDEVGEGAGRGSTLNIPVPPGATGDVYLHAFDELVAPRRRAVRTHLGASSRPGSTPTATTRSPSSALAAGDYGPLTRRVLSLVPAGRRLVMLEGGYDLDALAIGSATVLREMAGVAGDAVRADHLRRARAGGASGTCRELLGVAKGCCDPRSVPAGARRAGAAHRTLPRGRAPAVPRRRHGARPARRCDDVDVAASVDFDATTDARPDEIKRLLRGWADAVWTQGERFGTIGAKSAGRTAIASTRSPPTGPRRTTPTRASPTS